MMRAQRDDSSTNLFVLGISLIELVKAMGGHCRIESRPDQGTRVTVEVAR